MHLKRIDIIGFKSFADKTILTFEPGVTGIVGPNGSGKSNITEAIRWVLGETSAKSLRGGKMPDIIFAGSETRKPLNIAEVTVVLDNTDHYLPLDFSEIAVTRRLNRNGDSDYFINKKRSRLRDIQELFMDSGLGKESFSIISQGKVEAIFNSKPEDRRGIFEEAAGVFKYKQKKKAAEQKLFETEDNLNRVNDIIFELQEQLAPLKLESQNATRHLALKAQLKDVEVAVTVQKITDWKKTWDESKEKFERVEKQLVKMNADVEEISSKLQNNKAEHLDVDTSLAHDQEQLVNVTRSFEQTQGKRDLLQQANANQADKTAEMTLALKTAESERAVLLAEASKIEQDILTNQTKVDDLEDAVNTQLEKIEQYSRSVKDQLADFRAEYIEVMQAETNVVNDQKHLSHQSTQEDGRLVRQKEKLTTLQTQMAQLTEELEVVTNKKVMADDKLAQIKALAAKKQNQLAELARNYETLQSNLYQQMGTLQQKQARLKSLNEIAQSHASYYQGVRGILRNTQLRGIVGAVAELMDVPAELAVAVETAMGGAMQNVVVENEHSAQLAIEFLKQQRLGRATFLPLTTIKRRVLPAHILTEIGNDPNFVGVASELVSYKNALSDIYGYLLGTTLVAKDLPSAIQIAKKIRHQYKVVSLAGDVMNAGGSMSGGASNNQKAGLLSQAKEQQELAEELKGLQAATLDAEQKVKDSQTTQQKLTADIQLLREKEEQGLAFLQKQATLYLEKETERKQLAKEFDVLSVEVKNAESELTEFGAQSEDLAQKLVDIGVAKEKIQQQMTLLETTGDANETLKAQAQDELKKVEKELALLTQTQSHLREQHVQLTQQSDVKSAQIAELTANLAEQDGRTQNGEVVTVESLAQLLAQLEEKQAALNAEIVAKQSQKNLLNGQINALEKELAELQVEQKKMLIEKAQLSSDNSRLETHLDNSLEFLREEYEMTFEKAEAEFHLTGTLAQGVEEIRTVKRDLQELGPVNLGAIEQFEQVKTRHEFLVGQRDDLVTAKDHLFATMKEMDDEVKQRFLTTFEEIRQQFAIVFPKMFEGGRAQLVLTNPDDLLNTGVEIEAQPPGKKLQNLNLLSGGERSLTAITLLFAILQVRPVPFTVLDEVEAALDEANVSRFGKYLRTFGNARQFIVVTHRKGTMVAADVLYGVTMAESGVSKVLSVKLTDVKENGEIDATTKKETEK